MTDWSEIEIRQEVSARGTITYSRIPDGRSEWTAVAEDWESGSSSGSSGTFEEVQEWARGWFDQAEPR